MRRSFDTRVCALLALVGLVGCSSSTAVAPDLDGNVIVGDAMLRDASRDRDAGIEDALLDAQAATEDAAGPDDAGLGDALPRDAVAPDATPVDGGCGGTATATLTASEAVGRAGSLDGLVVLVTGTATVGPLRCTERVCADGGACCNTCTADVLVDGVLPLHASECTTSAEAVPGCTGNECSQVCHPPIVGVVEAFRGRLVSAGGAPALELFEVIP